MQIMHILGALLQKSDPIPMHCIFIGATLCPKKIRNKKWQQAEVYKQIIKQ